MSSAARRGLGSKRRPGRPRKEDTCTACGVHSGDMLLSGKMALVLAVGCCDGVYLCASCIFNNRHSHLEVPEGRTA